MDKKGTALVKQDCCFNCEFCSDNNPQKPKTTAVKLYCFMHDVDVNHFDKPCDDYSKEIADNDFS
jgi:hypothetical protein